MVTSPSQKVINTNFVIEKKGMKIAKDHLGSSFDLKKSSGFVKWNSELMKRNKQ